MLTLSNAQAKSGSMRWRLGGLGSKVCARAWPAFLAAALVLSVAPVRAAFDDDYFDDFGGAPINLAPSIAVRLGFDGIAKIGDWLPVTVQVSNDGSSVTGELQVEVDDNTGGQRRTVNLRPTTIYTVPASLPSHSRKQYEIDVFLPYPTKSLTVKLMTDQGVLVQQTGNLQALSGSDVLCGTLSRNPEFFQQLKNLDLPGRQGKKPVVVALKPDDLPARQHAPVVQPQCLRGRPGGGCQCLAWGQV